MLVREAVLDYGFRGSSPMETQKEICKPNYERTLEDVVQQRNKAHNLYKAAKEYLQTPHGRQLSTKDGSCPFLEMIGVLDVSIDRLNDEINHLTLLIEKENESGN